MAPLCSRRHRFPPEIIQYAIWLYLQLYPELHRDVEELLAERGLDISYETALGAKVRPPGSALRDVALQFGCDIRGQRRALRRPTRPGSRRP